MPLYYTVYAENSAGNRAGVTCMLTTYDTTEPTARITPGFLSTSNPNVIKASVLVHDDSQIIEAYTGVGYGKGSYGDQMVPWTLQNLHEKPSVPSSTLYINNHYLLLFSCNPDICHITVG